MLIAKTGTTQAQFNTTHPNQSNYNMGDDIRKGSNQTDQVSLGTGNLPGVEVSIRPTAKGIGQTEKVMKSSARLLSQMKSQLDAIIKNYPPYPVGDSNRAQYLKTFSGLRKEIERMTIPRDVEVPELSLTSKDSEIAAAAHNLDIIIKNINGNSGENITEGRAEEVSVKAGYDLKAASASMTTQPTAFLPLIG